MRYTCMTAYIDTHSRFALGDIVELNYLSVNESGVVWVYLAEGTIPLDAFKFCFVPAGDAS